MKFVGGGLLTNSCGLMDLKLRVICRGQSTGGLHDCTIPIYVWLYLLAHYYEQ